MRQQPVEAKYHVQTHPYASVRTVVASASCDRDARVDCQTTNRYNELQENVMQYQIELKAVTEELDEVKSKMETLSTTVTDTGPIVKIKDAFAKLRAETCQIDVKIGVVAQALMQAKLRHGSGLQPSTQAAY